MNFSPESRKSALFEPCSIHSIGQCTSSSKRTGSRFTPSEASKKMQLRRRGGNLMTGNLKTMRPGVASNYVGCFANATGDPQKRQRKTVVLFTEKIYFVELTAP